MKLTITLTLLTLLFPIMSIAEPFRSEALFNTVGGYGCVACHGKYAHGSGFVGGNIRGATRSELDASLEQEPSMLLLANALDENKRNILIEYLASLSEMQLLEWRIGESKESKIVKVKANHKVQLVFFNSTFEALKLDLSVIGADSHYQLKAFDTQAIQWLPKAGRYLLSFNNEHFIIEAT